MNPRVLLWLAAHQLSPNSIVRLSGDDIPQVTIAGERNLWTVHYSQWISKRWRDWAATLGFVKGSTPWREALLAGHSDAEFDRWLQKEVG